MWAEGTAFEAHLLSVRPGASLCLLQARGPGKIAGAQEGMGLASSPRLQGPRAGLVSRVMSPAIRSARVSTECGTRPASGPLKYGAQQWAPPPWPPPPPRRRG